jgi:hypothetical protein
MIRNNLQMLLITPLAVSYVVYIYPDAKAGYHELINDISSLVD